MIDLLKKVDLANSIGDTSIAVQVVKEIVNKNRKLSEEEKKAFSVTYRTVVGEKKYARDELIRIIEDKDSVESDKNVAESMKKDVEAEIKKICEEVFSLVKKIKLSSSKSFDSSDEVYYKFLEADFTRYLVEILPEAERKEKIKKSQSLYEDALKIAKEKLKVSDNLRLQLVVNYGSFGDEWLNDDAKIKTKQEVEKTLSEALVEIEKLADDEFVKTATILSEIDKLAKK